MPSSRSLNRQKKKPALNFGDFMLPILGIILVVILVLGIKVLFFGSKPQPSQQVNSVAVQPEGLSQNEAALPQGGTSTQSETKESLPDLSSLDKLPSVDVATVDITPVVDMPTTNTTPKEVAPKEKPSVQLTKPKVEKKVEAAKSKAPAPVSSSTKNTTAPVKVAVPQTPKPIVKPVTTPTAPVSSAPAKGVVVRPVAVTGSASQKSTTVARPVVQTQPQQVAQPKSVTQPVASQSSPSVTGKGYSVQTGSFSSEKAAQDVVADLKSRGFSPRISRVEVQGRSFYRVYVAAGATAAQASAVEQSIKALNKYETLVVKDQ